MHLISRRLKSSGKKIGLVPTMGYLHKGHLSLVKRSKELTDITIVSIFVNPTQFAPNEDLEKYPRDIERDRTLLTEIGVDYLFFPEVKEIYPDGFQSSVEVSEITKQLEGESRPTHFEGVTTVVSILFNSINPNYAFFGQKDAQQSVVIKRMVKDLKFDLEVIVCPIVRESDGLAMSSRNVFLTDSERKDALVLNKSLILADEEIRNGNFDSKSIISVISAKINAVESSSLDYVKIVNANSFIQVDKLESGNSYFVLIACKFGSTRLIDNLQIKL